MSSVNCTNQSCAGFTRPVALEGWQGNECGEKMFAFEVSMPHTNRTPPLNNYDLPAIWFLNGKVVRTNQWGCNCRGEGAAGGCGELDFAEAVPNSPNISLYATLYSFKQSLGSSAWFNRPVSSYLTFVAVFNATGSGSISLFTMNSADTVSASPPFFPFNSTSIPISQVQSWISNLNISGQASNLFLLHPYTYSQCYYPSSITLVPETTSFSPQSSSFSILCCVLLYFLLKLSKF